MDKAVFGIVETTKKEREKVNVKDNLAALIERYFKASNENYDTLMEEMIVSRLETITAADLIE